MSGKTIKLTPDLIASVARLLALALLLAFGGIFSEAFFSVNNLSNIITNTSIIVILGIAQTIVVITNGPDLSSGSIVTICAVVAAILIKNVGCPIILAVAAAFAVGVMIGCLNGIIIAKIGVPSFISTYGLQWAVFGFAYAILHGYVLYDFPTAFRFVGNGYLFGVIPMPIIVMIIVILLSMFLMNKTTIGRRFFAVGSNSTSARMSGINTANTVILAFAISGFLSALAGIMLVARINAVQADIGKNYLLTVLATVYMGGTSPAGGEGTILGTVIGALIITIVTNIMNLLAVPSVWRDAIIGVLIIATVLIDIVARNSLSQTKLVKTVEPAKEGV